MRCSSVEFASVPRKAVGTIQSAIGSTSIARLGVSVCQGCVGEYLYLGDVIETGADSSIRLAFNDGTVFALSSDARLVLDEFVCDPDGIANLAVFSLDRGAFAFCPGRLARAGGLRIDTPVASIQGRARGTGIGALSLAVLAFSLLQDAQDAHALSTDDDTIALKDSDFGTFEIVTRSGTVIQVDDPAFTYSVDQDGSIARSANSSARMEELQLAQQAVLGTYSRGFQGPGGSGSPLDFELAPGAQPPAIPINFQPLDPIPERVEPTFALFVEEKPEFPGLPPDPPAPQVSPPAITAFTFDSGIDGDRITNQQSLVLSGTADPGTIVTLYDGGEILGSTTADGSGTWSFETGTLSDGEHAFTAAAGAAAAPAARMAFAAFATASVTDTGPVSAAYIVVIDSQPPSAPVITAFADNSDGPADNLIVDSTPALTINAEAGSTVHVYRDGALVGTATETATPGIFTFTSESLADGCYGFTATATDAANNTSPLSCKFEIEIDGTAPPAPEIIALAHNCYCPEDNLTDDATPTLTVAAEAGSTVRVYRDGVFAGLATETSKAGIFTFTPEALADGSYTFTATATDKANNTSPASAGFAVAIITSDPNDFDDLATGHCIVVDPDGTVHGTPEADTIHLHDSECDPGRTIYAGAGNDCVEGTDQGDLIYGGSGNDRIDGNRGADIIYGGFGKDTICGGNGDDTIIGGFGADFLSGGKGHDSFVFLSEIDSPPCQPDTILDFESRCDRIDLSAVDANSSRIDDQAFNFVVGQTHDVVANSVTWYYDPHSCQTYIRADTDGDIATAEIEIALAGRVLLTQSDFHL
jgi:Ca2+-binding RTX toxin-like protein